MRLSQNLFDAVGDVGLFVRGTTQGTVSGGVVVIPAADGTVTAYNATDGNQLWLFKATKPVRSAPLVIQSTVYFGSDDDCQGGSQREWLFDVTNPASPRDVSPPNYWGWYYRGNPTGFNQVMPRSGKFVGSYFYRSALSLMDIHKWNSNGNPSPTIFVGGPTSGAPGDVLTFSADAAICTPNPSGWSWNASGGFISSGATGSSIQVSWSTAGEKNVTATNSACGTAIGLRSVAISSGGGSNLTASFNFSPSSPQPGQSVLFDASASTGYPLTPSYSVGWRTPRRGAGSSRS